MARRKYKKTGKRRYNRRLKKAKRAYRKMHHPARHINRVRRVGIADSVFVKLVYKERYVLNAPNGSVAANMIFSMNSPRDPYVFAFNKSAMYFSTYAAQYGNYRTHASKINIQFLGTNSTNGGNGWRWVIVPLNTKTYAVTGGDMDNMSVQRYAKEKLFINTRGSGTISHYLKCSEVAGVSKVTYAGDPNYMAQVSSDPNAILVWSVNGMPIDQTTASTYIAIVEIEYYVEFFNAFGNRAPADSPFGGEGATGTEGATGPNWVTLDSCLIPA